MLPVVGLHGQLVQFVDFKKIREWISDPEILVAFNTLEEDTFQGTAEGMELFTTIPLTAATSILKSKQDVDAEIQKFLDECKHL